MKHHLDGRRDRQVVFFRIEVISSFPGDEVYVAAIDEFVDLEIPKNETDSNIEEISRLLAEIVRYYVRCDRVFASRVLDKRDIHLCLRTLTFSEYNSIELLSDVIFELNELPDNYNDIADSILVPMARDSLLNSLDDILVTMGYNKMGLAKKMQ